MPVWLFSSGPIGKDDPKPKGDPKQVAGLMEKTKARGHRIFAGEVDKSKLGFAERAVTRVVGAPEGDFRDWDAIRAWAGEIAESLHAGIRVRG
jgi:menaquinone-dependent protoporphyrinogen oxidase